MDNEYMAENNEQKNVQKLTKEDLRSKPDDFVLDLVKKAKGCTGKDFSTTFNCDFSYSFLRDELYRRGWVDDWHKATTEIVLTPLSDHRVRHTFPLDQDIASEWSDFIAKKPFKSALLKAAMQRFMADCKEGRIKLICDIND